MPDGKSLGFHPTRGEMSIALVTKPLRLRSEERNLIEWQRSS